MRGSVWLILVYDDRGKIENDFHSEVSPIIAIAGSTHNAGGAVLEGNKARWVVSANHP